MKKLLKKIKLESKNTAESWMIKHRNLNSSATKYDAFLAGVDYVLKEIENRPVKKKLKKV